MSLISPVREAAMDKQTDGTSKFVHRHISQLKVLARLMEHELDNGNGGKEVAIDRELAENMLDTLEIFVEDFEGASTAPKTRKGMAEAKPNVTRLN